MCLAFGHSDEFRYIVAHTISSELGSEWCGSLQFPGFSGFDTVSMYVGHVSNPVWSVRRPMSHFATKYSASF